MKEFEANHHSNGSNGASRNGKCPFSSSIVKKGKSIAFTRCELHQNDNLIAVSSATNKLVNL